MLSVPLSGSVSPKDTQAQKFQALVAQRREQTVDNRPTRVRLPTGAPIMGPKPKGEAPVLHAGVRGSIPCGPTNYCAVRDDP